MSERLSAEAKASQARIDQLDDATREMLTEYRNALQQTEALKAYNKQLQELTAAQRKELVGFQRQLDSIERTQEAVTPQMSRMVEVLGEFIAADLPFLPEERADRPPACRTCCRVPTSARRRSTGASSRPIRSKATTAARWKPGAANCRAMVIRVASSSSAWAG